MRIFIFLFILFFMISCDEMKELAAIKDAENINLCLLDDKETINLIQGKEYYEGREVLKVITLNAEDKKKLLAELLKKSNYEPLSRKCPFEPVYVLRSDTKLYFLLDAEYCPTIEYEDTQGNTKLLGIKTDNTLKTLLAELVKQ